MQYIGKFDPKFSFFELKRNVLLLNVADKNYSKEPIYISIFFCSITKLNRRLKFSNAFAQSIFKVFFLLIRGKYTVKNS